MAAISLRRITKQFGNQPVLRGIDLDIRDGEFVALVGPSGCGKSTLLRLLAGLEPVSGGEVYIAGERVNEAAPRDRNIAMVFQNYALYPHMTVAENLGFSLKLRKLPQAEIDRAVSSAAEVLGLGELLGRRPKQLSGGQRQRVAMGRAIVRQPRAFLFDEPLSNLDAKLRVQMRTEIRALHQRLGTTTVYVTHDQVEAMTMADRIVVLRDGAIEQVGAPLDLYDRPANAFVAGFIGSPAMNFLGGRLALDGTPRVELDAGGSLPLPAQTDAVHGRRVVYGLRPEHVELTSGEGLAAEVLVVEPTGSDTQVAVRCGGQQVVVALRGRLSARSGDRLTLRPLAGEGHLFDEATGRRLAGGG